MNAKALYVDPWGRSYAPHPKTPPRSELLRVAVDFDGTLAAGTWSPDNPTSDIGAPIPENIDKLHSLVADGFKIWIHTARPDSDYEAIESWLDHYDIPFNGIVTGKVLAIAYIDDRGVHASHPSWSAAVAQIIGEH